MKSKSSTGYDEISYKLIKQARSVLVKPLTLLMNQIIHTGEFPDQLKLSRVKPLFKKEDQCCFFPIIDQSLCCPRSRRPLSM